MTLLFGLLSRGGPILAIWSWLRNGHRGHHLKVTDERLALHNARAYLARGEMKLAYALAQISSRSRDDDIARQSVAIMLEVEAAGGDYWNYSLPDPWAVPESEKTLYAVLPFAIPTALAVVMYIHSEWRYFGWANQPVVVDGVSVPVCKQLPRNGDILTRQTSGGGKITLRIRNRTGFNAILKVRDGQSGTVAATLFVAHNKIYDFEVLTNHSYRLQYAVGDKLDASCKKIIEPVWRAEFGMADSESIYIEAYQIDYGSYRTDHQITNAAFDKP